MTFTPQIINFPEMVLATQSFENSPIADVAQTLINKLSSLDLSKRISAGQRVAITAGHGAPARCYRSVAKNARTSSPSVTNVPWLSSPYAPYADRLRLRCRK